MHHLSLNNTISIVLCRREKKKKKHSSLSPENYILPTSDTINSENLFNVQFDQICNHRKNKQQTQGQRFAMKFKNLKDKFCYSFCRFLWQTFSHLILPEQSWPFPETFQKDQWNTVLLLSHFSSSSSMHKAYFYDSTFF